MQIDITAARPYAQAVFELARDQGNYEPWSESLNLINLVVADTQMKSLVANPTLKAGFLTDLVVGVCGDRLTDEARNFVRVLAEAGRLSLAPQIARLYEQQRAETEGIVEVEVVSAYPLAAEEQQRISEAMARRLGKKITISASVDADLIGGVVIRAGDSVIDASVKGRLRQLGNVLAE